MSSKLLNDHLDEVTHFWNRSFTVFQYAVTKDDIGGSSQKRTRRLWKIDRADLHEKMTTMNKESAPVDFDGPVLAGIWRKEDIGDIVFKLLQAMQECGIFKSWILMSLHIIVLYRRIITMIQSAS